MDQFKKMKFFLEIRVIGYESKWDAKSHERKKYEGCVRLDIPEMDVVAFIKTRVIQTGGAIRYGTCEKLCDVREKGMADDQVPGDGKDPRRVSGQGEKMPEVESPPVQNLPTKNEKNAERVRFGPSGDKSGRKTPRIEFLIDLKMMESVIATIADGEIIVSEVAQVKVNKEA